LFKPATLHPLKLIPRIKPDWLDEYVWAPANRRFQATGDVDELDYCYRALMNFDVETKLPIRVHIYDWNDTLIESYGYEATTLDAGLTEADFDPNNPAYRF